MSDQLTLDVIRNFVEVRCHIPSREKFGAAMSLVTKKDLFVLAHVLITENAFKKIEDAVVFCMLVRGVTGDDVNILLDDIISTYDKKLELWISEL